jgi:hypothetical protein
MTVCYGCLQPFGDGAVRVGVNQHSQSVIESGSNDNVAGTDDSAGGSLHEDIISLYAEVGDDDEFLVEEPSEATVQVADVLPSIRFHVAVSDLFGYDIYLNKVEGAQLTIGCARDNNIVLPHTESRRHILRLYYTQGLVWAENRGSTQQAFIDGVPLTGTRHLKQGVTLKVGEAKIEFVNQSLDRKAML